MTANRLKKSIALLLSLLIFSQTAMAAVAESNVWDHRRKSTVLAQLPLDFSMRSHVSSDPLSVLQGPHGNVRKLISTENNDLKGPLVVHIQDIHGNPEAQQNIATVVSRLMSNGHVGLVALEGAFSPIDLSHMRTASEPARLSNVAHYFLKTAQISGPIFSALTARGPVPPIVGIDSESLYQENVQAYLDSSGQTRAFKSHLSEMNRALSDQKKRVLNAKLAALDADIEAYQSGEISIGVYLSRISSSPRHPGMSQSRIHFPSGNMGPGLKISRATAVENFLEAFQLENKIDFSEVERERSHLIARLVPTLDARSASELASDSVALRDHRLSSADFYSRLYSLCRSHGVRLESYPALKTYFHYASLTAQIDSEKLFADMRTLETSLIAQLAKTPEEKEVMEKSRTAFLLGRLADFSLTIDEWKELKAKEASPLTLTFRRFYEKAEERDVAMVANLLNQVPPSKGTIILVTGGFHSHGMDAALQKAGFNVASFVPAVSKVDTKNGSGYLSLFAQARTPLEKIFDGEKLFLSPLQTLHLPDVALTDATLAPDSEGTLGRALPGNGLTLVNKETTPDGTKAGWKRTNGLGPARTLM